MRSCAWLLALAACSRSSGGAPPPSPASDPAPGAWTFIQYDECGFSIESPGAPETVGLHLACVTFATDITDPKAAFEIGESQIFGKLKDQGIDAAPQPVEKPNTLAGHTALGVRFALAGGRTAVGGLVVLDHRLALVWTIVDPAGNGGLPEADFEKVIASFRAAS